MARGDHIFVGMAMVDHHGIDISDGTMVHWSSGIAGEKSVADKSARKRGARILRKPHLWQVSRDIPSDMSWRAGLGFDYSVQCRFHDPDLNEMPSQVGYLYLPTVVDNSRVPPFIKAIYQEALTVEIQEAGA